MFGTCITMYQALMYQALPLNDHATITMHGQKYPMNLPRLINTTLHTRILTVPTLVDEDRLPVVLSHEGWDSQGLVVGDDTDTLHHCSVTKGTNRKSVYNAKLYK